MNLGKVKGILIDKDGVEHPFGIHKKSKVNDLGEDNYHDSSFAKDILPTEWFKSLNYNYTEETIHKQAINLAALGIIFLENGCSITQRDEEYLIYTIMAPKNMTEKQKKKMEESYEYLNNLINSENAYFEGMAYLENTDYAWPDFTYTLDEFYDNMGIEKKINNQGKSL